MTLVLSIAALLLGPAIYAAGRTNPIAKRVLNASILLTIAVIIAIHISPEALEHGGKAAIIVILAGLAFPMILERLFRKATDTAHLVIVALAATGLLVHAVVDGIALLPGSGTGLAYAIVLHRLPVGMAVWWAIRPNFGKTAAMLAFALIILSTTAGYFAGDHILEMADARTLAMLQAFVSGSLIHVVTFGVKHDHH
ncbi:MAG: hypothetical protein MUO51_01390 [Woeseiaceae bacterium]|nr:hypothetical protein [Woeseiaceae bacterium]